MLCNKGLKTISIMIACNYTCTFTHYPSDVLSEMAAVCCRNRPATNSVIYDFWTMEINRITGLDNASGKWFYKSWTTVDHGLYCQIKFYLSADLWIIQWTMRYGVWQLCRIHRSSALGHFIGSHHWALWVALRCIDIFKNGHGLLGTPNEVNRGSPELGWEIWPIAA